MAAPVRFGKNAGKILIAGGFDRKHAPIAFDPLASTELYDPADNTFLRGPRMADHDAGYPAVELVSGPR